VHTPIVRASRTVQDMKFKTMAGMALIALGLVALVAAGSRAHA
jgi:hypothetical protein